MNIKEDLSYKERQRLIDYIINEEKTTLKNESN